MTDLVSMIVYGLYHYNGDCHFLIDKKVNFYIKITTKVEVGRNNVENH